MGSAESLSSNACHVVAVPFPGRGHINPLMNLCKALVSTSEKVIITFVVTEEWLRLVGDEPSPERFQFRTLPNIIPSELGRVSDYYGFYRAVMTKMEAPFELLLDGLDLPVKLIVCDTKLGWPVRVGNRRDIPMASFMPMSASMFSVIYHFRLLEENGHFPIELSEGGDERLEYIPGVSSIRVADVGMTAFRADDYIFLSLMESYSLVLKSQYLLLSSLHELEHHAINAIQVELPFPVYAVGSVTVPHFKLSHRDDDYALRDKSEGPVDGVLQWLDRKAKNSILYVSLGSYLSVSSEQMDELMAGLRDSGISFVLVARSEVDRLKDKGGDKGLVVGWCDQIKVLSHSSTGGFLSHCGWNSTKEGLFCGVTFLTFPILADQMLNSKLIVEDWKVGWRVKKEMGGECSVRSEEIASMVRRFMDAGDDEVKEMRERAEELQNAFQRNIEREEGVEGEIRSFIEDITSR